MCYSEGILNKTFSERMSVILQRGKLAMGQFLSNSNNVRAILILSTLLIAALAGGAPSDHGGS
jgi:hypothetical protein